MTLQEHLLVLAFLYDLLRVPPTTDTAYVYTAVSAVVTSSCTGILPRLHAIDMYAAPDMFWFMQEQGPGARLHDDPGGKGTPTGSGHQGGLGGRVRGIRDAASSLGVDVPSAS